MCGVYQHFFPPSGNDADMKQATGKTTGKDALDFSLMQAAAEAGLQAANALFMVSYLLLCWNIMARTNNISGIVFEHLNWVNDCLEVDCFITKSDQAAKKANQKHVYANPLNPIICPILALAMYLLDRPDAGTNNNCIYPGTENKGNKSESSKFLKGLGSLLTLAGTILMIPVAIARYGAHSLRKGGVSFAAGGSTMAPSVISIILRAGWSIKGVESRYFRFQNAMDQFLGRVMAGLPLDSGDFAILPPFFVKRTAEEGAFLKNGKTQQSSSPGFCWQQNVRRQRGFALNHNTPLPHGMNRGRFVNWPRNTRERFIDPSLFIFICSCLSFHNSNSRRLSICGGGKHQ